MSLPLFAKCITSPLSSNFVTTIKIHLSSYTVNNILGC